MAENYHGKKFYNIGPRWRCYKTFFLFDGVEYSHASREFVNGRLARNKRNNLFGLFGSDGKKSFIRLAPCLFNLEQENRGYDDDEAVFYWRLIFLIG
jgi:hypothetical protein